MAADHTIPAVVTVSSGPSVVNQIQYPAPVLQLNVNALPNTFTCNEPTGGGGGGGGSTRPTTGMLYPRRDC